MGYFSLLIIIKCAFILKINLYYFLSILFRIIKNTYTILITTLFSKNAPDILYIFVCLGLLCTSHFQLITKTNLILQDKRLGENLQFI